MLGSARRVKKSYQKGDVLLTEAPFAFVLNNEFRTERCDHCFKKNQVKKCSGCSFVYYCDRICQKKGWIYHKYECPNIVRFSSTVLPNAGRLLARIIIKLQNGGAHEKSYYTETKFRTFRDLMSHYNEVKKDMKKSSHFVSLSFLLHKFFEDQISLPNQAEMLSTYGKMVINSFNILDEATQIIGSGVYLAASIIDHSCSPNALAMFDGTTIIIKTIVDLESLDWEKVHISYIEQLELTSARQKDLQSTYYFLCKCKKCLDVDELNLMTSTICQKCNKCIKGGALETTLKCSHCNAEITADDREKINEVIQFSQNEIDKINHLVYIDTCQVCLKKQENILHSMNIHRVKMNYFALDGCVDIEKWEEALKYGEEIIQPFNKYLDEFVPQRGFFFLKMAKIASQFIEKKSEAISYFKEAVRILSVVLGRNHPLLKEEMKKFLFIGPTGTE